MSRANETSQFPSIILKNASARIQLTFKTEFQYLQFKHFPLYSITVYKLQYVCSKIHSFQWLLMLQGDSLAGGPKLIIQCATIHSSKRNLATLGTLQHWPNVCLPGLHHFHYLQNSCNPTCHAGLKHSWIWSAMPACVPRRRETNFNIFCSPIIIISSRACIHKVLFSVLNHHLMCNY